MVFDHGTAPTELPWTGTWPGTRGIHRLIQEAGRIVRSCAWWVGYEVEALGQGRGPERVLCDFLVTQGESHAVQVLALALVRDLNRTRSKIWGLPGEEHVVTRNGQTLRELVQSLAPLQQLLVGQRESTIVVPVVLGENLPLPPLVNDAGAAMGYEWTNACFVVVVVETRKVRVSEFLIIGRYEYGAILEFL
jgi:hypothetical protein